MSMLTYRYRIKDSTSSTHLGRMAEAINYVWNYCQEVSLLAFRRDKTFLSAYDLHKLTAGTSKDLRLSADTIQQVCTEYATRRKQFKRGQRLGALPVARATGTQKPGYPLKAGHRYTTMVSGL
jgi:putative transposase